MSIQFLKLGIAALIAGAGLFALAPQSLFPSGHTALTAEECQVQVAACPAYLPNFIQDPVSGCTVAAAAVGGCVQSVNPTTLRRNCCTTPSSDPGCAAQPQFKTAPGKSWLSDKLTTVPCPIGPRNVAPCNCSWWGGWCSTGAAVPTNCTGNYVLGQPNC